MYEIGKINRSGKKPVVLLSPLDWGLGHTTRCIPIIRELIKLGCTVIIACNSIQKALLIPEFPGLTFVHLQGYDLRYGKTRWGTLGRIFQQLPKILIKINNEKRWLNIFLKQQPVDIIISDNRFGLYSRSVCSVFISHQLHIKTGLGSLTNRFVQWLNYRRINQFTNCWVPDFKGPNALAGELSNPDKLPGIPLTYLGGLSRLEPCAGHIERIDVLIILSGPEPQRTLFEKQLLKEVKQYTGKVVLARGLPKSDQPVQHDGNLTIYNHAPAPLLNKLICGAEYIISRTGYTTVMDLLKLGKKGILVPTPGQAEQEYLADHLYKEQFAYTVRQHQFSLQNALQAAREFRYKSLNLPMEQYKAVIRELLCL